MNRIKSLDGLRAIPILMVILGHAGDTIPKSVSENLLFKLATGSTHGVTIFFVISGYLITRLMMAEEDKTGKIDVKDFYLRRAFRIFPVFYLYILTLVLLKIFVVDSIFTSYNLVGYASLYLWNYQQLFYTATGLENGYWFFGHLWSLAMEEQFYLIWPLLFVSFNRSALTKLVIGFLLALPVMRIATYILMPDFRGQVGITLHTGGDSILI